MNPNQTARGIDFTQVASTGDPTQGVLVAMAYTQHYGSPTQASRMGRSSITIYVKDGAKPMIRAALADGGYGTSYQEGLINMLNDLLSSQNRPPMA